MKAQEIRQQVTDKLVKLMQEGQQRPWRQPWNFGPNAGIPVSQDTGKAYRGGNAIILDLTSLAMGYKSKYWNTFQNWSKHKIFPRQGQKATWGMWWGKHGIEEVDEDGEKSTRFISSMKTFYVFNAEQCHGDKLAQFLVNEENKDLYEINYSDFDEIIKRHNIVIRDDERRAAYVPGSNVVIMPKRGYFNSVTEYYNVLGHELCHWAESNLGIRHTHGKNGNLEEYADFELSAEIGGAYLVRECGIPAVETEKTLANSALYLKGWLQKIKADSGYIFTASARSAKLVDFLMGREYTKETTEKRELVTA